MKIDKWLKDNTATLSGKTVAVTGATGGLGSRLCRYLAALGAHILMLDRNYQKSLACGEALLAAFPHARIGHLQLDLADMDSVRAACDALQGVPIDYLILNAGAYKIPRAIADSGYDNVFQINFVAPYYMVKRLLPSLRRYHTKVVAVSSIAHNYAKIDLNDIDFSHNKSVAKVYGNSKRFLTFALYGLFRDEGQARLAVAHPGVTLTNMTNHYPKAINGLVKAAIKVFYPSPDKAALSILSAVFCDCGDMEWIGPRLCGIWGYPEKRRLRTCKEDEAQLIYQKAEEIYAEANERGLGA